MFFQSYVVNKEERFTKECNMCTGPSLDDTIDTLGKEARFYLNNNKKEAACIIYGAMVRLVVVHQVDKSTIRKIIIFLNDLPEAHAHAKLLWSTLTEAEQTIIGNAEAVATLRRAARPHNALPPLMY